VIFRSLLPVYVVEISFFSECWHKTILFSEFFVHSVRLQLGSSVREGGTENGVQGLVILASFILLYVRIYKVKL